MNPQDRPQIIAVDFDGTLVTHEFPGIGKLKQPVVDFITRKHERGNIIMLWTTRDNERLKEAKEFLKEHDVPIDCYNENFDKLPFKTSNRIYADLYIGDRMMNVRNIELLNERLELHDNPFEKE